MRFWFGSKYYGSRRKGIRQLRAGYVTNKNVTIIKEKISVKKYILMRQKNGYVLAKDAADIIGDVLGVKVKVSEACNSVIIGSLTFVF